MVSILKSIGLFAGERQYRNRNLVEVPQLVNPQIHHSMIKFSSTNNF